MYSTCSSCSPVATSPRQRGSVADLQVLDETVDVAQEGLLDTVPRAIFVLHLAGLLVDDNVVAEIRQQYLCRARKTRELQFTHHGEYITPLQCIANRKISINTD